MPELLFDRNLLRKNHHRYLKSFKNYDFLHREVALRIVDSLLLKDKKIDKILEISSKDQFLIEALSHHSLNDANFTPNNWRPASLGTHIVKQKKINDSEFYYNIKKETKIKEFFRSSLIKSDSDFVCDDEFLPFKNESFDLILSNLNLHFINDVPSFLSQIHKILRKNGIFIASFFGEQNLFDLKKAVFEAENKVFGGFSPRLIPTIDVKNAARLLQNSGFRNPVSSLEIIEVVYKNPMSLLKDLKFMIQGNIMLKRSKKLANRQFLDEILKNYAKIASFEGGVKAKFEIVIIIGEK